MARLVIMGGGISGHTAASYAKKWLKNKHEVIVVTPNSKWNWIPSNIWVGVGDMEKSDVEFEIAPIYKKAGIIYKQAKALSIHPEGSETNNKPFITIESTNEETKGDTEQLEYDYLINATGPKLNFGATPGLDQGFTQSVCTSSHAVHANDELQKCIKKMKDGERQSFLVGSGHGLCTCQGAAFEYIFNIENKLNEEGVRDKADITYISNESFLGDFGMGSIHFKMGGFVTSSKIFAESIYAEKNIDWILGAHVKEVQEGKVIYENLQNQTKEQEFDFAMLIPPFSGVGLKAYDKDDKDITDILFAPNGFMKVDADYSGKAYDDWKASDWPIKLQNPTYGNIFAIGIAFAPPHIISKPMKNENGTPINPTPPRTGMPSAIMGEAIAKSIVDMINGAKEPTQSASMAHMGAACVASMGKGFFSGSAATMTIYPIIPDFDKYPTGRDLNNTFGEVGLAGHWLKHILHHTFIYKAKLKPGWSLIPE